MSRIVLSKEVDAYYNVAAEYQMFLNNENETILYLWQNEKAVILGRNQNLYKECNLEYLREQAITPVRRFSGGGAVFHDLGNLNVSFITPCDKADMEKMQCTIRKGIRSLGVECTFSGRNDLLCNGQKFSGHAYYEENDRFLFHCTIMVDVNMEKLSKALTPSCLKLKSKGIDSVKSRVINLSEVERSITVEIIRNAITKAFIEEYGVLGETKTIDRQSYHVSYMEKLKSKEWLFGESPDFDIELEKKIRIGNVLVRLKVNNGMILEAKIYTDSLMVTNTKKAEKKLIGKIFDENIFDYIEQNML